MATKLIKINGKPNSHKHREYICDTEDDINLLPRYGIEGKFKDPTDSVGNAPCSIGSTALVCSTSEVYILAPNNEWTKL